MAQCTATAKATGERCRRAAMHGRTACMMHGGKTPRGHALPQTTHGRYSKDLPTRLADRFTASERDPDLLNLTKEIALTDALVEDALHGLDHGETGRLFRDLKSCWDDLQTAQRAKDAAGVQVAMSEIGALIRQGVGAYAARAETMDLVERRRRLVDSEQKRRVAMQDMMTSEQAMLFGHRLLDAVNRHVDDPDTRAAIAADIVRGLEHDGSAAA